MLAASSHFMIAPGSTPAALLKDSPLPALEARILVAHALGWSRVQLITRDQHAFTPEEAQTLSQLFQRRLQGEPIAYIIGQREFYGLNLQVTPDVLIPRPETELLVELTLERLPQHGRILDMGTGSGAIAVAIAHQRPDAQVSALDQSAAALAVAQANARTHGAQVEFLQSDWYAALGERRFDVIVSNPPYIRAHDPHLSEGDLRFEPQAALTDHADGLSAFKTIIAGAPLYLMPGGWLLFEHGYDQADSIRALLQTQDFGAVQSWQDLAGIARISGGKLPGPTHEAAA